MRTLVRTMLSVLLGVAPVMAQTDRATLTGTVTDAQGASVRGASVTATAMASGVIYTALTNSAGVYVISSLPVGSYTETINGGGFQTIKFQSFALQVGETREMNAKMAVAAVDTVVQVSTEEDDLNRVSAEIGGVVQGAQLNELPMNGRSFERLEASVPGAVDAAGSTQDQIRFVGLSQEDNNFHMDGVDASGINHQFEKLDMRLQIPVEAISQFKASSAAYSADQGGSAGGQIEIVTKSGGEKYHGSAWEYLRNNVFDATPWHSTGLPQLRLNNFGANIGGPILKNRFFFFTNWEAYRQVLSAQVTGLVPTPAYRAALIAKSPSLAGVVNSYINPCPANCTPTAKDPNAISFSGNGRNPVQEDSGMVRLDYKLSTRTSIFGRYSTDHFRTTAPNGIEVTPGGQLSNLFNTLTAPNAVIDITHNFTPSIFTDFRIGYNRDEYSEGGDQLLPYNVAVTGFATLTTPATDDRYDTAYSVVDDTTFVKGGHVFKGGVRVRRIQENKNTPKIPVITATYLNETNFTSNVMDSYAYQGLSNMTGQRQTEYGAYLMDTVRLKQNLTLTAGLRYDFWSVDHDVLGRGVVVDPSTCPNIQCPSGSAWYFPDRNNIAPRLSLSWSPAIFHNKTVISGGGGIFYGQGQFGHQGSAVGNIPQRFTLTQVNSPGLRFPIDSFLGNAAFSLSPSAQDRNRKDAQISEWTLSVQQLLSKGTSMMVSYIGSVGSSLWSNTVSNGIDPSTGKRPYASYSNSTFTWNRTQGDRAYNALEVGLHRDYRTGLMIAANYQLSHSIDTGSVGGAEAIAPQNQSCISCERANSQFDMRHYFSASSIWQVPVGRGHAMLGNAGPVVNAILGGWQMAGVGSIRGGLPLNVTLSRSASVLPDQINSNQRPNLVPGASLYPATKTTGQWLNAAAFAVPADGTWGNLGRNAVRGPGHWQADMALQKTFKIWESLSTSFRAEAFNVFNVAQYGSPIVALTSTGTGSAAKIVPGNFGLIQSAFSTVPTGSGTPRQLELSLRIDY